VLQLPEESERARVAGAWATKGERVGELRGRSKLADTRLEELTLPFWLGMERQAGRQGGAAWLVIASRIQTPQSGHRTAARTGASKPALRELPCRTPRLAP